MTLSEALFRKAEGILVGGVNSPVRAFKSVGGTPIFFKSGEGPYLISEDGDCYIDYVQSWGPLILGHAHPAVVAALASAAQSGCSFGAPCKLEIDLAEKVQSHVPSCEKLRFVNSGSEATMGALRLARGFTGRSKLLKFQGAYHGAVDSFLVEAGSGSLTQGVPNSAGVPKGAAEDTLVVPYNDLGAVRRVFNEHGADIAAVIVEPVAGNMGVILPDPEFLPLLRDLCDKHGGVLIFDEVMTGFRVALGGAQQYYKVKPDLTCLGKVLGGGLPCAAFGGRADVMNLLAPEGDVYHAGTLSGNPLAMAAGLATLTELEKPGVFSAIEEQTLALVKGLESAFASQFDLDVRIPHIGTMFSIFFSKDPVRNLSDAQQSDTAMFKRFFRGVLNKGLYMAPSPYETNFVSIQHRQEIVDRTVSVVAEVVGNSL